MKTILLMNDDGIESPGLIKMKKKLEKLGEVFVIVPREMQTRKLTCMLLKKDTFLLRQSKVRLLHNREALKSMIKNIRFE